MAGVEVGDRPVWSDGTLVTVGHELGDMTDGSDTVRTEALADVEYLSRSPNRPAILGALADGPFARRELAERTGTSRTTLDRIVNELEGRGWAERTTDGDYVATTAGRHVIAETRSYLDALAAIRRLDETVDWLPGEELTIGLSQFADAVVHRPDGDPIESFDHFTELVREAGEMRALTHLAPPGPIARAMHEGIVDGDMTLELVLTHELVDFLRAQAERRERIQDLFAAGATGFVVSGPIPCNLWIIGDRVLLKKSGPEPIDDAYGIPIESGNDTVRSWAGGLIDEWRAEATRVDADTFVDRQPAPGTDARHE